MQAQLGQQVSDDQPEIDVGVGAVRSPFRSRCGLVQVLDWSPSAVTRTFQAGDLASLVWLHGGAFRMGDLDMPEADRTSREICERADAVVVSVDYRLRFGGVTYPVPHDDTVAALRWVRDGRRPSGSTPPASRTVRQPGDRRGAEAARRGRLGVPRASKRSTRPWCS